MFYCVIPQRKLECAETNNRAKREEATNPNLKSLVRIHFVNNSLSKVHDFLAREAP